MNYAGFWRRLGAGFIDVMVLNGISMIFGFIYGFGGALFLNFSNQNFGSTDEVVLTVVPILFSWAYYAGLHSSKYQATLGMMAFSMHISDYAGERISFWRASLRLFSTILSWILVGIGFLMMAFTPRKQALHDYIARTLVEKKDVNYKNEKNKVRYAGLWRRVGAGLIDGLFIGSLIGIMMVFALGVIGISQEVISSGSLEEDQKMLFIVVCFGLLSILFSWGYYACFQSSRLQATPGMKAFSIRITDYAGERISFWRASGRFFAAILSGIMLYAGYLMMVFTPRKQALHDYIAKTLVVRN
ncbi:MAG: hypothetical protein B7Y25_03020 [Alphaproteobacteria bacterium 16-39-46]|nr:MAG: hypothetical protein B7Y25_03020 [Alphaproteobacteria bacterium 16-39-46]OZA43433.1 MAG: hypothetical protein B7X84_03205 [Alphaproteobacteria bacterium 17-39-52]HQS83857.1 RDD family protein [Alphaproteobacteria bacterium]HQS93740.1 RDD family protein [Alphaproteobacteria bacterium]